MHTSLFTKSLGYWRAIASGLIIGAALVAGAVWAAYIPAPASFSPGNNASTPIYEDATTQNTTNLGVKRDTAAVYDFAVKGSSKIINTFISQQNVIFVGSVGQSHLVPAPSTLDIQGNLYAVGTVAQAGNILDEGIMKNKTNPAYSNAIKATFTDSEPVCTTQAGVLVRCLGCTNSTATNYDPAASTDDGSCNVVPVPGCMNPLATNYNANATVDNGSCVVPVPTGAVRYYYNRTDDLATWAAANPSLVPTSANSFAYNHSTATWNRTYSIESGNCPSCTVTKFIVPNGVTSINVEAWGAGGGGGVSDPRVAQSSRGVGGAGSSGSYIKVENVTVTPGEALQISIDDGGASGYYTCPPSAANFPNLDNNNNGTIELSELIGTPQYWDMSGCTAANSQPIAPETPAHTTITRPASNTKIIAYSGRGGGNSVECAAGTGGGTSATPISTLTTGTITTSTPAFPGMAGTPCGSAAAATVAAPGLCPQYKVGYTQGNDNNRYCWGGSSGKITQFPVFSFGNPGLVRITW